MNLRRWIMPRSPTLLLLGLLLLLSACGFRLRGNVVVPPQMQETYIKGAAAFSDLGIELKKALERSGAKVVAGPGVASAQLNIASEQLKRRVLSVDKDGRASEYELTYEVMFELRDNAEKVLVPMQTISPIRDYKFDPNNVLAKDTEEVQLRKSLVSYTVQQMMRRLEAGLKHPATVGDPQNPSVK
jgi:LPS-assembly lipoprotein